MTTTRWIGSATVWLLTCFGANGFAWSADAPPPQPNTTVSSDGATASKNTKADDQAAKPAAPAKPVQPAKSDIEKNRDFKPSEDISEDMSVAYPSDI